MVEWPDVLGLFFMFTGYTVYVVNIHDWLKEKLGHQTLFIIPYYKIYMQVVYSMKELLLMQIVSYSPAGDLGSVFNEGTVIDVDCLLQPRASALFVEIWRCLSARNATTSTGRD